MRLNVARLHPNFDFRLANYISFHSKNLVLICIQILVTVESTLTPTLLNGKLRNKR